MCIIQPNKACWILANARVADVSEEGWNDEGTAFSHGIFVKQWVKFRTHNFCPDKSEREMASGIERRAKQIFAEKPEILVETDEEGHENLFAGDLGYVQAAEEQGWIRVKPLPRPVLDNSVYLETFSPDLKPKVAEVVEMARNSGLKVVLLTGGAIANRGFWVQSASSHP
jgi:phosphoserine phosphatase